MDKLEPWIRPEKGSSMDLTLWREAWNDLDAPEDQPDLLSGPPCPKTPSSSFSGRSDLAYSPNLGLHSPSTRTECPVITLGVFWTYGVCNADKSTLEREVM